MFLNAAFFCLQGSRFLSFFSLSFFLPFFFLPDCCLCISFSTAANKLCCLKQHRFILSQFQKPKVQNQPQWTKIKVSAEPHSLRGSKGESVPRLFHLLGLWHSLACGHSAPVFKTSIFRALPHLQMPALSGVVLSPSPPPSKDPCDPRCCGIIFPSQYP